MEYLKQHKMEYLKQPQNGIPETTEEKYSTKWNTSLLQKQGGETLHKIDGGQTVLLGVGPLAEETQHDLARQ